jgi:hypothetical protein
MPGSGRCYRVATAEFEIYGIEQTSESPLAVRVDIRYDVVARRSGQIAEERVGSWRMEWSQDASHNWKARKWEIGEETLSAVSGPAFIDVTEQALGGMESYAKQMLHGADYWRTVLDGAIGVDVYGNNGVATGDFDNDGFDDIYVCQPAGLPNRLYRNRGDGTFEDVTEKAGVGVLDNTACALFADFENRGLQDLLVVCGTGPICFSATRAMGPLRSSAMPSSLRARLKVHSRTPHWPTMIATGVSISTSARTCTTWASINITIQSPTTMRATARRIVSFITTEMGALWRQPRPRA